MYAWNATDGPKKGVSITELPNERFNVCDVTTLEHESSNSKADKAEPCFYFKPKPTIVALLLHGTRLAVIISEESLRDIDDFYPPISIRVYDISVIPTDGSSLKLLAKSEKPIKASYFVDAISNENIGYLVFTSEINLEELQLSRDKPQYCGLNSTEYTDLAMMTASNMTDIFIESLLEELQLLMDGSCANIFMVTLTCMPVILDPACVHSSYTPPLSPHLTCYVEKWFLHCKKERASGKTLGSFVRVFRFDMKSDFFIDFDVVGAFFTGLPIV